MATRLLRRSRVGAGWDVPHQVRIQTGRSAFVAVRRPAPGGAPRLRVLAVAALALARRARRTGRRSVRIHLERVVQQLDEALLGRAPVAQLRTLAGGLDAQLAAAGDAAAQSLAH